MNLFNPTIPFIYCKCHKMVNLTQAGKSSLDAIVAQFAAENATPGFVLGATTANEEVYLNSGGNKVYNDPSSGQIDKNAVFWICSMTKMVAHIAALQLIDQGKLSPDDPLSKYFPQFAKTVIVNDVLAPTLTVSKPGQTVVRVKHLLNFSSGLFYRMTPDFGIALPPEYTLPHERKDDPHGEFFSIYQGDLPGIPLAFEPGTDFVYGFSSDVLGFLVEKITGKSLDEYMQENIFKPLDIRASFFLTPDLKERLFPLYYRTEDGKLQLWDHQPETRILERDPTKVSRLLGGVGLYMCLPDYLKLLRHLLQIYDGKAKNPILKAETVKAMFVPALNEKGAESVDKLLSFITPVRKHSWSNALGVCGDDYPNGRRKGSACWSGWAGTHFFIDPVTGIAAVFGTQITSLTSGTGDAAVLQIFTAFEQTLYANLA